MLGASPERLNVHVFRVAVWRRAHSPNDHQNMPATVATSGSAVFPPSNIYNLTYRRRVASVDHLSTFAPYPCGLWWFSPEVCLTSSRTHPTIAKTKNHNLKHSMAAVASIRAPNSLPEPFWDEILEDEIPEVAPTQAISGRNINPTKLISLLRTKFGAGAYDIHVSVSFS